MLTAHAQQLPNYGFDNWKASCASTEAFNKDGSSMRQRPGVEPTDWNGSSVNQKVSGVTKEETLVFNDGNAVKMVNTYVGIDTWLIKVGSVAPGFVTLGTPWVYAVADVDKCDGGVYGGVNFTYKPDAITGRYKRTDATGEKSHIIAYLWNGTYTSKVGSKSSPSYSRDNVARAIMGKTTPTASGTLVASCDYEFTATTNKDWQTITVPLNYTDATSAPTMMNVIISGGDYWDRSVMKENTTLYADDVRFVYYSTLNTLTYDGKALAVPEAGATLDMSTVVYDASKLAYTLNGRSATATTSYDDASGVLTITVSNVDNDADGLSSHTYYIQFAHVHGAYKYAADGESITVTCGKCGEKLGTVSLVIPADLTYTGKAKAVTLNGAIEGMENPTVVYSSGSAPINVGTYTATIQLGDATASVEYTIKAKDIAGATVGAFAPMTYTGKAQTPAATVTLDGWGAVTGTWAAVTGVADKTTFTASGNYTGAISNVACGMQTKDIAEAIVGKFAQMTYTGQPQMPEAIVTLEGYGIVSGTWEAVTNITDKTAFTANGNYSGVISDVACGMQAKDIAGAQIGEFAPMTYTGEAQMPAATVTLDGFGEVTGSWSEVLNVGDKTTFTASGNYVGALTVVAQMTPQTVAVVSAKVEDVAFDANGEYTLVVTDVVFDAVEFAAGVDYTAEAQLVGENVEGATSEVLITFTMLNGNYVLATNTLSTTVTLLQHQHEWQYTADGASILATCKDADSNCPAKVAYITLQAPTDAVYSGAPKAATLVGNYPGLAKLAELITYSGDCIDAGRYVASISYEGVEATLEFEILPKDITDEAVVGEFAPMTYTGEAQVPAAVVTLEGYGEITGSWGEVVNVDDVATFTANGNYTGTVSAPTGMTPAELTLPVVEGIVESYEYTGCTIEPKVTVMNGETLLVEDVDYVVTYSDNVEAGVGTVLITFIGNYSGTLTLTFEIIDTAIEDILTDEVKVCYDLYGRRVLEPLKGELYIVNGKKVRW